MTLDIIIMLASTIMGFVFKMMANSQKDRAEQYNQLIGTMKQENKMLEAARAYNGGKLIRRFITFVVVFSLFMLTVGSGFIPGVTSMISEITKPEYIWGLFGGGTEIKVTELKGMVYSKDITHAMYAITGFYFGSSSAGRN